MTEPGTLPSLGIVELGRVCADMRARNLALFEQLGAWVADTPAPELQRLFAEACHRHAWHAELWAERAPTIPGVALDLEPARSAGGEPEVGRRAVQYAAALAGLLHDLEVLAGRVDRLLDPSTTRTLALVTTDLTDLRDRLTAAVGHDPA